MSYDRIRIAQNTASSKVCQQKKSIRRESVPLMVTLMLRSNGFSAIPTSFLSLNELHVVEENFKNKKKRKKKVSVRVCKKNTGRKV